MAPGEAGTLYVETDGRIAATGHIKAWGPGTIQLAGGTVEAALLNIAGGSVTGSGTVDGDVANNGYVNIGNPSGDPIGEIEVLGDYTQTSGELLIDIGGSNPNQYDRLVVDGWANLGGTLDVTVINGYEPALSETFYIVDANARSGEFVGLPDGTTFSADGFNFRINYFVGVYTAYLTFSGYTLPRGLRPGRRCR